MRAFLLAVLLLFPIAASAQLRVAPGQRFETHGVVAGDVVNDGEIVATGSGLAFLGRVSGAGRFRGRILFHGVYSPGNSPAEVFFENFAMSPSATLVIELGGTDPGSEHDVVRVANLAELDGTLRVELLAPFEPALGDRFEFLTAGTIEGRFATLDLPPLAPGLGWQLVRSPTSRALRVMSTNVPAAGRGARLALASLLVLSGVLLAARHR